ncbi:MAG: hypothetical protein H7Z41_00710 [Cytophagales bacterium]|nr:hypothetical protein [Armatimonadota bacterium]
MKITSSFFVAVATLALLTTGAAVQGQQMPGGANGPSGQQQMEKELGITPQQKTKLDAIGKKYLPKLSAVQKKYTPQAQALQKQMVALQQKMQALNQKAFAEAKPTLDARQKEMDTVLTATQKAKIKQIQAAQSQGGMRR